MISLTSAAAAAQTGLDAGAVEATVLASVGDDLAAFLDAETQRWAVLDPSLAEPIAAMRALVLAGGKRLRPAFCIWGHVAAGGDPFADGVRQAGCALELLHTFALIHDDVMDGAATRRGAECVHVAYDRRHRAEGWAGESRRISEGVAILVGDLAFVYADAFLASAPPHARELYTTLRVELVMGQYLDVLGGTRRGHVDDRYARTVARYKSGKYTIERPLHLGAALAGPDAFHALGAPLSAYGLPLGDAFQLRDDILGAFGTDAVGKPVGDDLREGKPTPMLAAARAAATPAQAQVLDRVGDPALDAAGVEAVCTVLVETGARRAIETEIRRLTETAVEALADPVIDTAAVGALERLADRIAWRDV